MQLLELNMMRPSQIVVLVLVALSIILAITDRAILQPIYLLVLALVVMYGTNTKFPWGWLSRLSLAPDDGPGSMVARGRGVRRLGRSCVCGVRSASRDARAHKQDSQVVGERRLVFQGSIHTEISALTEPLILKLQDQLGFFQGTDVGHDVDPIE
jgi:hypothetical protein